MPLEAKLLGRDRVAYKIKSIFAYECKHSTQICFNLALTLGSRTFLVVMRLGDTPVLIPNTMVKT